MSYVPQIHQTALTTGICQEYVWDALLLQFFSVFFD